ncbi:MAG: ACT domain-containing protein, partial [Sphingobium phenoxybenzoativorans]
MSDSSYLLTLSCPNQPGIVARVTAKLFEHGGNILEAHQFDDTETGRFFTRILFNLTVGDSAGPLIEDFDAVGAQYGMDWAIRPAGMRRKVLLLASKFDHCLVDLLYRWRNGELKMDVVGIVSNHPRETFGAADFGEIPFHYLPVSPGTKSEQEAQIKHIVQASGA